MPGILLRPYVLSYKNRLLGRGNNSVQREIVVICLCSLIMLIIYVFTYAFLSQVKTQPDLGELLPQQLSSLALLGLFFLLLFSNTVGGLGFFYYSRDIPLLLTLPISKPRFYFTRLMVSMFNSSWIFILLGVPALLAYQQALDLPITFFPSAILFILPVIIIPAAIAIVFVILFINLIPIERMRESLIGFSMVILGVAMLVTQNFPLKFDQNQHQLQKVVKAIGVLEDPHPFWLPSRWSAALLAEYFGHQLVHREFVLFMLIITTLGSLALGYLIFDALFMRGWTRSLKGRPSIRVQTSLIGKFVTRLLFPFGPQFRAMFLKEGRMFLRDTTQCIQLILLLVLTLIYIYNFRALRLASSINPELQGWWKTILCLANIGLGGCVVSAISTRFVFPAISIEGPAYWIVRSAPISLKKILYHKFFIWLIPMYCLTSLLFVSGAWAIEVPPPAILVCLALAGALSVGIVGAGIGIGAVYAKFDWESATQVAASFGSLIFMLLALAVIMVTIFPSTLLIILSTVPGVVGNLARWDYLLTLLCASFLVFYINFAAARWALNAGYEALRNLEK